MFYFTSVRTRPTGYGERDRDLSPRLRLAGCGCVGFRSLSCPTRLLTPRYFMRLPAGRALEASVFMQGAEGQLLFCSVCCATRNWQRKSCQQLSGKAAHLSAPRLREHRAGSAALLTHCVSWGIQVGKSLGCFFFLRTGNTNWKLKVGRVPGNFIHLLPCSTSHVLEQPCNTLPPYPQFFSPLLTRQGFLLEKPPSFSSAAVESIPVLAALQSSPVLHMLLYSLYKDLQKLNTRRWASFFSAGVEEGDFQEALQELRTLSQCYETEFEADEYVLFKGWWPSLHHRVRSASASITSVTSLLKLPV